MLCCASLTFCCVTGWRRSYIVNNVWLFHWLFTMLSYSTLQAQCPSGWLSNTDALGSVEQEYCLVSWSTFTTDCTSRSSSALMMMVEWRKGHLACSSVKRPVKQQVRKVLWTQKGARVTAVTAGHCTHAKLTSGHASASCCSCCVHSLLSLC